MKSPKDAPSLEQKNGSIRSQIDLAAVHGQLDAITPEKVREGLQRDLYSAYLMLAEILADKEILEAIAGVFYSRVLKHKENQAKQPELPLNEGGE